MRVRTRDFFAFLAERSLEIIPRDELQRKLFSRRHLRVKLGIDPTTPDLHLGHAVPLRLLRSFQDAGHHAVLVIGDFTGQIGDPSGRRSGRRTLSSREIQTNARTYRSQVGKILAVKTLELRHNRAWFDKLVPKDFLALLARFSIQRVWEREDFQKRIRAGQEVHLAEAVYPVLQAYDSVMVRADVEIGSLDQKLNLLAGRELQRKMGQRPQNIVLTPYLIGVDGAQKMSKTAGNAINLGDSAAEMFGKIMSIPDVLIRHYAELAAWWPSQRVDKLKDELAQGRNPRDVKLDVAEATAGLYHGSAKAAQARRGFIEVFSQKRFASLPARQELGPGSRRGGGGKRITPKFTASFPRVRLRKRSYHPVDLLLALGAVNSKSEARRLLHGRAVEVDGRILQNTGGVIRLVSRSIIRVGKKKFFQIA